jgi:predicted RNA binding protein YcfA (HicA-like mRNA interferase family)
MARLKRLSARQILRILRDYGFTVVSIRGSHAKLKRGIEGGPSQILTIPLHKELAPGTVLAIYRQALRFIHAENLLPHFYGTD